MLLKINLFVSFILLLTFSFNAQKTSATNVVDVQSEREISQKEMNLTAMRIIELSAKTRVLSKDHQYLIHKKINSCLKEKLVELALPDMFLMKCSKDQIFDYTNKFYSGMFHFYECALEAYTTINK
jgi:hypothetical protein